MRRFLHLWLLLGLVSLNGAEPLVLQPGDHLAIVGEGLADRQQHFGYFETLIHQLYPTHQLVIRNLGFSGDEVNIRHRSDEVPTLEYFLNMKPGSITVEAGNDGNSKKTKATYQAGADFHANVIFAYWGFNESFKGAAGLNDFKLALTAYLKKQQEADYGKGPVRVVLFSPIAHETMASEYFNPAVAAHHNENLALYTAAMAEVAQAQNVRFVDLFTASQKLYATVPQGTNLTINGVHLSEVGDQTLASIQYEEVFGKKAPALDEKLRALILDKNNEWRHRYRTVDQYNIFGGRSRIKYEGVDNATVLGRELASRDIKTVNRDHAIWAYLKGETPVVKDDNLLPSLEVPPNRKEPIPYLSGEEQIKYLSVPEGCKVEFVADETTIPELINPVQMNFDTKGRLWVSVWPNYPETRPDAKDFDKLLILDLDPKTGKVAHSHVFLDGLNCPTGFQFYKDGVILIQSPDIWYVRDTSGKMEKANWKERILTGMDAADSHHETNSICYEPGGALYFSDGVFLRSEVETPTGVIRNFNGAIYRFEPQTYKFERYICYDFANPHGRLFTYWGDDLISDASGNRNYFGPGMSAHSDTLVNQPHTGQGFGANRSGYPDFWKRPARPVSGTGMISSRHFPDDWQGTFLNANVITYQGIFRVKMTEGTEQNHDASGVHGETLEPGLIRVDTQKAGNFRPAAMAVAPDGSIYVLDWSQMLIGHLQHHLRDPNRDHQHGRIYRITYPSRPLLTPKVIDGQPIAALLELLKEPEDNVRTRAKIELHKHPSSEVIAATQKWAQQFDPKKIEDAHPLLEALWVHQWHNAVNLDLIHALLASPEYHARAQAVRVVCYQRDRIPEALNLVIQATLDTHPRVQLEALRALSFFHGTDTKPALQAALRFKDATDQYLAYSFRDVVQQLASLPEGQGLVNLNTLIKAPVVSYGPTNKKLSKAENAAYQMGKAIFAREGMCATCHQTDGQGADMPPEKGKPLRGAYPSLVDSAWLQGDPTRAIKIVLNGMYGPMTFKGKTYGDVASGQPAMTPLGQMLKDDEVAAVLTYVRQSWKNNQPAVTAEQVRQVRETIKAKQPSIYTPDEILKEHPLAR